jgi:hypothetical protein
LNRELDGVVSTDAPGVENGLAQGARPAVIGIVHRTSGRSTQVVDAEEQNVKKAT